MSSFNETVIVSSWIFITTLVPCVMCQYCFLMIFKWSFEFDAYMIKKKHIFIFFIKINADLRCLVIHYIFRIFFHAQMWYLKEFIRRNENILYYNVLHVHVRNMFDIQRSKCSMLFMSKKNMIFVVKTMWFLKKRYVWNCIRFFNF